MRIFPKCDRLFHRLKHENLVDMVGFSCDGQHPCLVYALMVNGSLLDRLACLVSATPQTPASSTCALPQVISEHSFCPLQEGSPPLSWRQRSLIAEGTARGLEYLHGNHHVHRDVKRYVKDQKTHLAFVFCGKRLQSTCNRPQYLSPVLLHDRDIKRDTSPFQMIFS